MMVFTNRVYDWCLEDLWKRLVRKPKKQRKNMSNFDDLREQLDQARG
jgi:hypothetical protein